MGAVIYFKSKKENCNWVSGYDFEYQLTLLKEKIFKGKKTLTIKIPAKSQANINTIVRLLNVVNQFESNGFTVSLDFIGKTNKLVTYLKTIGFFTNLGSSIKIKQHNPKFDDCRFSLSGETYVSLHKISNAVFDKNLPSTLAETITKNIPNVNERTKRDLFIRFKTIFSELTKNICEHSQTQLNGFAALQLYKNGQTPRAEIVVCDSGIGLLETLRPSLRKHNSNYANYSDKALIVEMLTVGISSKPPEEGGGNGLNACFLHAQSTNSDLHIRVKNEYYHLYKVRDKDNLLDSLIVMENVIPLDGTLISFVTPLQT